ncbi:MAG: uncharacterized protein QOD86_2068, partial [Miltoncostaeaceae bacterium]|nr:uncharacterized protein [Miltoncostaeaceae bacterium]
TTIGGLTLASGPARIGDDPTMAMDPAPGFFGLTADYFSHASEDAYWQDRTLQPSRLTVPILADTGFYDPEARGPYEAFKLTRHLGSHLLLMGAHDGFPAGTGGPFPQYRRWFERYLLGVDNGIDREPAVQAWIGKGSRQKLLAGEVVRLEGEDWPLPGTRWRPMYLSNVRSGTAKSLNDGTLSLAPAPVSVKQVYSSATSNPLGSDPQTTSVPANTGAGGYTLGGVLDRFPSSTEMNQLEPQSLTYTSAPLGAPMDSIGPASLHARLASTSPETDIHAVVADVWPDGTAHPVAVGRLRTSYPRTIASRSVVDPVSGETVQPYADFSAKTFATPGVARDYDVEIWPIGNRFGAGHRIRLYLTGTSGYMVPAAPSVNTVTVGGPARSRLVLPSR